MNAAKDQATILSNQAAHLGQNIAGSGNIFSGSGNVTVENINIYAAGTAPPSKEKTYQQAHGSNINYLIVVMIIGVMACGLLVWLWWTREHIAPLNGPIGIAIQEKIKISSPSPAENVRTGCLKVHWNPNTPKIIEFYRNNVSIEKTSFPVLPGTCIYLNQPGEIEIKLWTHNGTVEDQVKLTVVGMSLFRTIIKLTVIVLFIVIGFLAWLKKDKSCQLLLKSKRSK